MFFQVFFIQLNTDRQTLHDLDPVAGGILGWQQRERATGTDPQAFYFAVILDFIAVQIGNNGCRLTNTHGFQLGFFKVGIHPYLIQRHNCHQGSTWCDALTDLHIPAGNITGYRCQQAGALFGQICLT